MQSILNQSDAVFRLAIQGDTITLTNLWVKLCDKALRIRTANDPLTKEQERRGWFGEPGASRYADNYRYEAPDYLYLRRVLRVLDPSPADVFFDIGSGKGRMLCLAARRNIARCIGIELHEQYCAIARSNAKLLRGRRAPVEIRCADATSADLGGGTIYYLYNPFGEKTMAQTIANLRSSVEAAPRSIRVVYYNPVHEKLFSESGWLEKYREFRTGYGLAVTFWKNSPPLTVNR